MSYDNLICRNGAAYTIDNTNNGYEKYYNATITYGKLANAYLQNNCLEKNGNTTLTITTLANSDYTSNPTNPTISTTCGELEGNLVLFGNSINTRSIHWANEIKNGYGTYGNIESSLQTDYQNVLNTRKKLDENVQKIITQEGSPIYEKQAILDSAVYTTLLWTVLATSVLYYAFTKL